MPYFLTSSLVLFSVVAFKFSSFLFICTICNRWQSKLFHLSFKSNFDLQTEETKNADVNGPKGTISSIGISIIVGWGYILGITFAVTSIPQLLSEDNDAGGYAIAEVFYFVFKSRYGSGVGGIICLCVVVVAIFFSGMSSITSNSRMAYSFSRDGAMPFSSVWHQVNSQEVPINAVWMSAFIAFCMALTVLNSHLLLKIFERANRIFNNSNRFNDKWFLFQDFLYTNINAGTTIIALHCISVTYKLFGHIIN